MTGERRGWLAEGNRWLAEGKRWLSEGKRWVAETRCLLSNGQHWLADRRILADDARGVSVTVNYALNLLVATLLIAGVLTATGGMVDDRRQSAARTELSVLGERIAAELMAADRLAVVADDGPATEPTVEVAVSLPERVAGSHYEVSITTSPAEIVLRSEHPDETVTVSFHHVTPVAETTVHGGDLEIVLTDDGDLEVSEA